jgi:acyl carrier protein
MNDVEKAVRDFIAKNFVMGAGGKPLGSEDSLMEGGIIDSTGVLELTGFLEEEYAIKVTDEELVPENLDSVASIVGFVQRKTGKSS